MQKIKISIKSRKMTKKIRVKTFFGAHQIYQEIVNNPPKNVEYLGIKKETFKGTYYQQKKLKNKLRKTLNLISLPRMVFVNANEADLIHSSRGFLILNKKPWVIDIEHPTSFANLNYKKWKKKWIKKIVKIYLESKYCKKIMFHCEASKKALLNTLDCSKFKHKIVVLYPATYIPKIKKKKHKKIRIFCMLSMFYEKGGLQILQAFNKLEKKYKNIELWVKGDVPEELKKKYNSKNIKYFPYKTKIIPRKRLLQKFHAQSDIFLYPSFIDSLGFSVIDAMACGLPVVANDTFAIPELIGKENKKFLIKAPVRFYDKKFRTKDVSWQEINKKLNQKGISEKYIKEMCKKISPLIENKKLREKYGKKLKKEIISGRFSIKKRNKKLRKIYEGALKK